MNPPMWPRASLRRQHLGPEWVYWPCRRDEPCFTTPRTTWCSGMPSCLRAINPGCLHLRIPAQRCHQRHPSAVRHHRPARRDQCHFSTKDTLQETKSSKSRFPPHRPWPGWVHHTSCCRECDGREVRCVRFRAGATLGFQRLAWHQPSTPVARKADRPRNSSGRRPNFAASARPRAGVPT